MFIKFYCVTLSILDSILFQVTKYSSLKYFSSGFFTSSQRTFLSLNVTSPKDLRWRTETWELWKQIVITKHECSYPCGHHECIGFPWGHSNLSCKAMFIAEADLWRCGHSCFLNPSLKLQKTGYLGSPQRKLTHKLSWLLIPSTNLSMAIALKN